MVKAVNMRSKRVLITGASGFIGSHIVNRIRKDNTVAVVMLNDEHSTRIEDSLGGIIRYNVDLKSTSDIMKVVADFKPDVILHLASIYAVNHKSEQIESLIETNVLGIINLLGLTKINTEQLCDFYSDNYGLNCLTLRIFPPYGPNDNKRRLVPYVIDNCLSNNDIKLTSGIQKWDFVYVEDIVDAYILSLRAKIIAYVRINIVSSFAFIAKPDPILILKYAKSKSKLF